MRSTIEAAPAKINLYLDIESKRKDSYHNIISVMQSVTLSDLITISVSDEKGGIMIACDDPAIPGGDENLAYRAAEIYMRMAGLNNRIEIDIRKTIPAAAGLGGGSSDAGAVLRGLNKLFNYPFSYDGLCRMGVKIGADVPFCIMGGCAEAKGIGELLKKLPVMPDAIIVISCPAKKVSTPEAYRKLDAMYGNFEGRTPGGGYHALEAASEARDLRGVTGQIFNIFESCVLAEHPEVSEIKEIMLSSGAMAAQMSGSGPAVFGIFNDDESVRSATENLRRRGYPAFICVPAGPNSI
jgi:4-diphosphocytidyl-2-C-methyl-D-erythritol kinase